MGAVATVDNDLGGNGGGDGGEDEAERVARFLRDNPGWLAEQGELYGRLEPPRRVHGERLADHMAAMIEAARERAEVMERRAEGVLRGRRTARTLFGAVRDAVLALIGAGELGEWIAADLPLLLGVDGAALCAEAGPGAAGWRRRLERVVPVRPVPPGTVGAALGRAEVRLRFGTPAAEAAILHGEAAALAGFEALVRVPLPGGTGGGPGGDGAGTLLLALASRTDPGWNDAAGAHGAETESPVASLAFLGAALGARIGTALGAAPRDAGA